MSDTAVTEEVLASIRHLSDELQVKRTWRRGSDPVVCEQIITSLREAGGLVTADKPAELREKLKLMQYSATEIKRAVGSLISRGIVIRNRPRPDGITASAPPITLRLSV